MVAHKLEVLKRHCDDVDRDFAEIERTMIYAGDPLADVDAFLTAMAEYAAVGIELVTMVPVGDDPVAWTTRMCDDVLPRLGEI